MFREMLCSQKFYNTFTIIYTWYIYKLLLTIINVQKSNFNSEHILRPITIYHI